MNSIASNPGFQETKVAAGIKTAENIVSRISYVDMLRGFLIALVIVFHAACTYNGSEDWTYTDLGANDPMSSVILSLFVLCCQSFFMGLYFFLSGVFTPSSYDKKGPWKFWKDRVLHLVIPMLIYTFAISRIPNYLDDVTNNALKLNFWQYSMRTFWSEADAGPTWFIFALLGFSFLYTSFRIVSQWVSRKSVGKENWTRRITTPGTRTLLIVAVLMSAVMFLVAQFTPVVHAYRVFNTFPLLLGFFPFYVVLFFGGILAHRNDWLGQWKASMLKFWGWFSIGLIVILPVFLIGTGALEIDLGVYFEGFSFRSAGMCLWLGLACVSFGLSLTLWLREKVKPGSKFASFAGTNSFAVFLIHSPILVAVSVLISRYNWYPILKFLIASVVSVILCFIVADVLRRLPLLKKIL